MAMKNFVSARVKITKNGKILRRAMSIGAGRTRKSTKNLKHKLVRKGIQASAQKLRTH